MAINCSYLKLKVKNGKYYNTDVCDFKKYLGLLNQ